MGILTFKNILQKHPIYHIFSLMVKTLSVVELWLSLSLVWSMSLAVSLCFLASEFSVYIMWICKCSSFAFLLLCRKSHKTPLWISLRHLHIMWESCINNSIKKTTRIIQWNPSVITVVICGRPPNPRVPPEHPAQFHHWCSHDPNQVPSRTLMPKSHLP